MMHISLANADANIRYVRDIDEQSRSIYIKEMAEIYGAVLFRYHNNDFSYLLVGWLGFDVYWSNILVHEECGEKTENWYV